MLASQDFPYVVVDATHGKARVGDRIVFQAVVGAAWAAADKRWEALGFDVGDSENGHFWIAFLPSLKTGALDEVELVISDAHHGLKKAVNTMLQGVIRQHCRAHPMRSVLAAVPKGSQEMAAAA
jgi:transposase-like protein